MADVQSLLGQNLSNATKSFPFLLNNKIPFLPPESSAKPLGVCAFIISGLFKSLTILMGNDLIQFAKLLVSEQFINKQQLNKNNIFLNIVHFRFYKNDDKLQIFCIFVAQSHTCLGNGIF